jgi:hypothetical protein
VARCRLEPLHYRTRRPTPWTCGMTLARPRARSGNGQVMIRACQRTFAGFLLRTRMRSPTEDGNRECGVGSARSAGMSQCLGACVPQILHLAVHLGAGVPFHTTGGAHQSGAEAILGYLAKDLGTSRRWTRCGSGVMPPRRRSWSVTVCRLLRDVVVLAGLGRHNVRVAATTLSVRRCSGTW